MTELLARIESFWDTRLQPRIDAVPRPTQDRIVGAALFFPTAMVLGLASWLTPSPTGMGTHLQLGLGNCTVLTIFGMPCPMCGMTTTFTHLAHLEVIQGTLNQPFGLFLFLCTVVGFSVGLADLVLPRGRWRKAWRLVERHETFWAAVLLLGMIAGWIYKIALVRGIISFPA